MVILGQIGVKRFEALFSSLSGAAGRLSLTVSIVETARHGRRSSLRKWAKQVWPACAEGCSSQRCETHVEQLLPNEQVGRATSTLVATSSQHFKPKDMSS